MKIERAEDLWPGDVIRAKAPGQVFARLRRVSEIVPYAQEYLRIRFDDGLLLTVRPDQIIEPEDLL